MSEVPLSYRSKALSINGEIYNHKELEEMLTDKTAFRTKSDCESVIHLYESRPAPNLRWTERRLDELRSV